MTVKHRGRALAALCLLGLAAGPATAAPQGAAATPPVVVPAPTTPGDDMVVTRGQVTIDGKPLKYTVHAGLLPIYDNDTGQLAARMFVIVYTADRDPGAPARPVTFVWNGGPGSSSSQVHLIGFGPQGFQTPATYPEWKAQPSDIGERPETWLAASDLVFVDPIGAGYSRATSQAWRDKLYTQWGDAEAVAEMIRVYRTRFDAFEAPIFLAGESYGTTRVMEVAADLARRRTPVAGAILSSHNYYAGEPLPAPLKQAMQVPLFTATAWRHKRLPPALQALGQNEAVRRAAAWARTDYAQALTRRESLSPEERDRVIADLARYTGLDPRYVDAKTLTVSKESFTDHLLEDQGLELSRYDARQALPRRKPGQPWGPRQDPGLAPMVDVMEGNSPALIRYLRNTLGYRSDLLYRGPWGGSFHPDPMETNPMGYADDWMALMWDHGAARSDVAPQSRSEPHEFTAFKQALAAEPGMLVWNVAGLYDLSCAERDEALSRADAAVKARVRNSCYPAGHMVYTDVAVRRRMQQDFTRFVEDAVAARGAGDGNR